jgi:DNA ligase D-like protein (predicted 3'-phosphoesterase)
MALEEYRKKRDFSRTPEPEGTRAAEPGRRFVVQKHQAGRLHYDFRLEAGRVLKSWAIPKGPSMSPSYKRLAIQVEDHPIEYRDFEGVIPPAEYGAGTIMVWDFGTYKMLEGKDPETMIQKGNIKFYLEGKKLRGGFALIRTGYQGNKNSWLLIKERDAFSRDEYDVAKEEPNSAKTGRTLEEISRL